MRENNKHIAFFLERIWRSNRIATLVDFFQYVLLGASSSLILVFNANIINTISLYDGLNKENAKHTILINAILLALMILFQLLFNKFSQMLREKHIYAVRQYLDREICIKLSMIPHDILDTKDFQDDFKIVNETNTKLYLFITYIAQAMSMIMQLIIPLLLLVKLSWYILVPCVLMIVASIYKLSKIQMQYWSEYLSNTTLRRKMDYYLGMFTNNTLFSVIKAFGRDKLFLAKTDKVVNEAISQANDAIIRQNKRYAKIQLLVLIVPISVALVAIYSFFHSKILVGDVIMYLGLGKTIHNAIISSGVIVQKLQDVSVSLRKMYDFLFDIKYQPEINEYSTEVKCVESIEIKNLTFYYPNSKYPALDNICLHVNSGDMIALVGENGSGKTTLIKILLGLYRNYSGKVEINGIDLKNISCDNLTRILAPCFQDFLRPQFIIREAIAFSKIEAIYDDKRIKKILSDNNCEDILNTYVLDTQLGTQFKGGVDLSIGQWQKIAIARAMYADKDIMLADEPMAAVDIYSELQMLESIKRNHKAENKKISILISHRMMGIKRCSKIFVLDKGKLVEEGTHDYLINIDGKYAQMYNAQNDLWEDKAYEEFDEENLQQS